VAEALRAPAEVNEPAYPVRPEEVRGQLVFDAVSFRYPGQDGLALDSISLAVEPGEKVALVGPAGSGKSTLLHLVPRFYEPQSGTIWLDGADVRRFSVPVLRSYAGMVLQDPVLFAGTIKENLMRGNPEVPMSDVQRVAEGVGIVSFIEECPEGYDTHIEERGMNLSGGQKQKLVLARTLLKRPRVLLLDDALSSLDTESERRIIERLDVLSGGATCLFVARRPSSAEAADRVVVLSEGKIVGVGRHEDLLATNPIYADALQEDASSRASEATG
jgi:ABC-type multidrug transport system fused ATPase/permease subunit